MVNCFLCFSQDKRCRFMHYHSILTSERTVSDVVSEYFPAVPQNISDNPSICLKCYTTLKSFSKLVDTIQIIHSYPKLNLTKCEELYIPIKTEPEDFEMVSAFELQPLADIQDIGVAEDKIEIMQEDLLQEEIEVKPQKPPVKPRKRKRQVQVNDQQDVHIQELQTQVERSLPKLRKKAAKKSRFFKDEDSHDEDFLPRSYKKPGAPEKVVYSDERTLKYISEYIHIRCHVCEDELLSFAKLMTHIKKKHPQEARYFQCCGRKLKGVQLFYEHVRICHINDGSEFECEKCKKKFKTTHQLYAHNYQMHPSIVCKTCGKKTPTQTAMDIHTKFHQYDECQFLCYRCKHECRGYYTLKTHLNQSHRMKRKRRSKKHERQCDRCGFICKHKMMLKTHMSRHRDQDIIDRGEGVTCPKCNRVFANEIKMLQHDAQWHKKIDHSICEICSKMVLNMQTHMKVHEIGERVKCPHCSRYLKSEFVLKTHIKKIHERDPNQKHICKECGKIMNSAATLWNHVKLNHKLKRQLPCRFCPKLMITPTDVKEHEATHTGVDLYFCEWCPKSFKFGASYRGHRKREHKGEYIPRTECKDYVPTE